jgi:hypothetical protein
MIPHHEGAVDMAKIEGELYGGCDFHAILVVTIETEITLRGYLRSTAQSAKQSGFQCVVARGAIQARCPVSALRSGYQRIPALPMIHVVARRASQNARIERRQVLARSHFSGFRVFRFSVSARNAASTRNLGAQANMCGRSTKP